MWRFVLIIFCGYRKKTLRKNLKMAAYADSRIIRFYDKNYPTRGFLFATTSKNAISRVKADLLKSATSKKHKHAATLALIPPDSLIGDCVATVAAKNKADLTRVCAGIDRRTQPGANVAETIKEQKPDLSTQSVNKYAQLFNKLLTHFHTPFFTCDTAKTIAQISQETSSLESRKNYLKAIIAVLQPEEKERGVYQDELNRIGGIVQAQVDENVLTARQLHRWVPYDQVKSRYEAMVASGKVTPELIASSFFCGIYFAPWRCMELMHLKFRRWDAEKDNYIDLQKGKIVLHKYKTERMYGRVEQSAPSQLVHIVAEFVKNHVGDYVLETKSGNMVSYSTLNMLLMKGVGTTANILRHSYVSWLWESGKLRTSTQMKKVAHSMRHSVEMMLSYRKILDSGEQERLLATDE